MEQRYVANNLPQQTLGATPDELLHSTLEQILVTIPPLKEYASRHLGGLFSGYTGLAYLFLRVAVLRPDLKIVGYDALSWAQRYMEGERGPLKVEPGNCGLACEKLSYDAVKTCLTAETSDLVTFLGSYSALVTGPTSAAGGDLFPTDLAYGRAGALYMLRMVEHWVPDCAPLLESAIRKLTERILATDDDGEGNWHWRGTRYFGACHGDIGIITQLVLTVPTLAPSLSEKLSGLLELQLGGGNWPSSERSKTGERAGKLFQWCHGAPGFITSLRSLRPHFPSLQEKIDLAVARAEEGVWTHGLLIKEPSLCHGIFGNALTLPHGHKREHFLALATVEAISKMRKAKPDLFAPANYGKKWSVLTNYLPSAAWAWAVCDKDVVPQILYNDV